MKVSDPAGNVADNGHAGPRPELAQNAWTAWKRSLAADPLVASPEKWAGAAEDTIRAARVDRNEMHLLVEQLPS